MADTADKLRQALEAEEALVLATLQGQGVRETTLSEVSQSLPVASALRPTSTPDPIVLHSDEPQEKEVREPQAQQPAPSLNQEEQPVLPGLERSPKKKRQVVQLRTEERRLLHQLGCTGVADRRHAEQSAGVPAHRLRHLVKQGFLQERHDLLQLPGGIAYSRYYVLGKRGRSWLRARGVDLVYRRNPRQFAHDLHLTEAYYHLPAKVRRTWVHESELIERLKKSGRYRRGYSVDAVVTVDGQEYAIEVAIRYKKSDLEMKKEFISKELGGRGAIITSQGVE